MGELKLNAIRLNTVSLNTMPLNSIGFKKKASSPSSGDVDENGYIIFADPEVARICAENWGDGIGITKEQAASVTSLNQKFKKNTSITKFNELAYFTNVKTLYAASSDGKGEFYHCANLEEVDLRNVTGIQMNTFTGCTSLKNIGDIGIITTLGGNVFYQCSILGGVLYFPMLATMDAACFYTAGIRGFVAPKLSAIPDMSKGGMGCFQQSSLEFACLGNISSIGTKAFNGCAQLSTVIIKSTAAPTLASTAFTSNPIASGTGSIYVPDGTTTDADGNIITIVEAYKAATNWSAYASRIFPISQLPIDNPELYAEIEEYL